MLGTAARRKDIVPCLYFTYLKRGINTYKMKWDAEIE